MEKKDFSIDQIVYLKIIEGSNAARYISNKSNIEDWIKEKVVTKIGSKYIFVADSDDRRWGEEKFDISNNFSHVYTAGGQNYELYQSKEDVLNDLESEKLYSKLKTMFSTWKNKGRYSLKQLQNVYEILSESK